MKKWVIIILLLLLTGCKNKISSEMPNDAYITLSSDIDVYSDIVINDIITETNVEIINGTDILNTDVIGTNDLAIYYTFNNKNYVYYTAYNVVDNEEPKIFGGSNKTVNVGYTSDLCNLVLYGDNYDSEPICVVEGGYDLNTVGTYSIKLIVTDNSGNTTNHNITLNVIKETNSTNNNTTTTSKTYFSEVYAKYKTDNTELGIDVSTWQGDIDFEEVANAGATFVIIRIGYRGEENINLDSQFQNNIKKAKEAGLKVGVYIYSKAKSKEEAEEEALWVIDALDGIELELPIAFDWEIWSGWNSYHLSFHELNLMPKTFIETVEKAGYEGMLYGSKSYLENFWDTSEITVWLAHYTTATSYEGNYLLWQFSNTGRIDGINGDVDLDVLYLY